MPTATMTWLNSATLSLPALSFSVALTPFAPASSFAMPAPVMIFMPCFASAFSKKADTSASSTGTMRSSISTTVTSAPRSL